jgi:hypothetical protein
MYEFVCSVDWPEPDGRDPASAAVAFETGQHTEMVGYCENAILVGDRWNKLALKLEEDVGVATGAWVESGRVARLPSRSETDLSKLLRLIGVLETLWRDYTSC